MLARTPFIPIRVKAKPAKRKLNRDRQRVLVDRIAVIMREAEPTHFAVEGPCRAGIRRSLCLQGWTWAGADTVAAEIVLSALNRVGAKRPDWYQGQPEYTQPGALPILRENCVRCARPLPDGHRTFCGPVCAQAAKIDRQRDRWNEESYAAWKASHAAWQARQPEQTCEGCGGMFRPKRKGQRFCTYQCTVIDRRAAG